MGYELPAAMGVRLAQGDDGSRVITFIGDGTFVMAPTELVTAAQEHLDVTIVVSENHGYQVIHRLQMFRSGREFGNEFRYRNDGAVIVDGAGAKGRLEGDYLDVDLRWDLLIACVRGGRQHVYSPTKSSGFRLATRS